MANNTDDDALRSKCEIERDLLLDGKIGLCEICTLLRSSFSLVFFYPMMIVMSMHSTTGCVAFVIALCICRRQ